VDRNEAITRLPTLHAVAVRLRDGGADPDTISLATAVDGEAVAGLLAMADAKLARLMRDGDVVGNGT
jgi:hypothetical protein